jgi:hypothetical protein
MPKLKGTLFARYEVKAWRFCCSVFTTHMLVENGGLVEKETKKAVAAV